LASKRSAKGGGGSKKSVCGRKKCGGTGDGVQEGKEKK